MNANEPAAELISAISSYLRKNRKTLPVKEVELLEESLHLLQHYRSSSTDGGSDTDRLVLGEVALRLTRFLTESDMLEQISDVLERIEDLL